MSNTLIQDSDIKHFLGMCDSVEKMLEVRKILGHLYPRNVINQGIRHELHNRAEKYNDRFYRHNK